MIIDRNLTQRYNCVMDIPEFYEKGLLPPGIYSVTWDEFVERFGYNARRELLLKGLRELLDMLFTSGCKQVYIDGSFVTSKEYPQDFDGCWEMDGVDPSMLDPVLFQFDHKCAAQKSKYFGEIHPIRATGNVGYTHLDLFQIDKLSGNPKGIILIELKDYK